MSYSISSVSGGEVANDSVTLAKMAGLARGKIIYGDASGDPAALAVGSANEVLTHDGTDISWEAAAAGGKTALIGTVAASGSATLTVTGITSTYDTYLFAWSDIRGASDEGTLYLRVGDDDPVDSGASDYQYYIQRAESSATTYAASVDTAHDSIRVSSQSGNATGEGLTGYGFLNCPTDGLVYPTVQGQSTSVSSTAGLAASPFYGCRNAVLAIDRIEIHLSGMNIATGRFTVWGIAHS